MPTLDTLEFPTLFWGINLALVFVICMLFTGILIPQILLISFRKKLFDVPDERKIHQGVVPRLGGIAFNPVILFSIALLLGIDEASGYGHMLNSIMEDSHTMAFGFCAATMLYLVGMADDLIGVRYSAKFVVQIACGIFMIAGGIYLNDLHGFFGIHALPQWLGYPLTILAVVFIINSVNLIDGIDGLASGLCGVATLFYGFIFLLLHEYIYALLAFATLGVLVPFFYYNVFGDIKRGKKIFMGDTGSMTIGMILSFLSIRLLQCNPEDYANLPNALILAFSPIIIPCLDVIRVYLHRVRHGNNPFLPDRNHIHHKLLDIGMHQRSAMSVLIITSILFILCNILLSHYVNVVLLLATDIAIWIVTNIWLAKIKKRLDQKQLKSQTVTTEG